MTNVFADGLIIELKFPRKSTAPMSAPAPILPPLEVSGNLLLDISPYPPVIEKDRYLVEYFIDDAKIYETSGFNAAVPDELDFKYILDTKKYVNGKHKIIVNFWDSKGQSAIGIRAIIINNISE